jgi:hypothetical protein
MPATLSAQTRELTKLVERLALGVEQRSPGRSGIAVVVTAPCGCPGCLAPGEAANSPVLGDRLLIELGCEQQITPPMPVPLDDEPETGLPPPPPAVAGPTVAELATGNPELLTRILNRNG